MHLLRLAQQIKQQIEFACRQVDRSAAPVHLAAGGVHRKIADPQHAIVAFIEAAAAQACAHPRQQFLDRKGLGEIVVGAGIEGLHPLAHLIARRDHQHRRADAPLAHPPAHLHAAEVGQGPVEQHQIPVLVADLAQGLLAGGRLIALISLHLQLGGEEISQFRIVVDNEKAGGTHDVLQDRACDEMV